MAGLRSPAKRYERIQATNTLGVKVSLFSETKNCFQKRKLLDLKNEQKLWGTHSGL
jgi:hypothetical protein